MNFAPNVIDPPPPFGMRCESPIELKRYQTWRSKEPETIAWIDSFRDGDVFFDVGANVGVYSLYCAAVHPRCRILACEPDRKNIARLRENANANGFYNVLAVQYAVSDTSGAGMFVEAGGIVGESGGQLGAVAPGNGITYAVAVTTVDALALLHGCPTRLKIDIDGQELRVVRGMTQTLQDARLRSVLIEVDTTNAAECAEIDATFFAAGFDKLNHFNTMTPHSRERRAKDGIAVENIVFTRG